MTSNNLLYLINHPFSKEINFQKSLGEEFKFCEHGNMTFHWADYHETCEFMKQQILNQPNLADDFRKREIGIERLRLIPVWIKNFNKVNQLSIFDLYESYILSKTHLVHEIDPLNPVEISFISGAGPFKNMAVSECFSQITYKDFVMVYLLKDKLPKRDYRLRLKAKVLMEYGENFTQARLINFEQLTSRGILLSLDSGIFMEEVSSCKEVRLLIETSLLKNAIGKSPEELKHILSQNMFNLFYSSKKEDAVELKLNQIQTQSSFEFLKNRKIYLYIGFDKIKIKSPDVAQNLESFGRYTREIIKNYFIQYDPLKRIG